MLKTRLDLLPVKEAYYGKTPNFIKAEKALTVIVNKINACPNEWDMIKLNVYETKENRIFEECMEKEFGFKKFNLFWDNRSVPNAFTVTGGLILETHPDPDVSEDNRQKHPYYDHKHIYTCNVVVMMNLVRKCELTVEETMSVILHEIGHNFDNQWWTKVYKFMFILTGGVILSEINRMINRHLVMPVSQTIQNANPYIKRLFTLYDDLFYHLNCMPSNVPIPEILKQMVTNPYILIFGALGTPGEYYSDAFAATYGYGEASASAEKKLGDPRISRGMAKSTIYSIPVLRTLYDLVEGPTMFLYSLVDAHPFPENRILAVRKKLEKDYADPQVPKALKPQIKSQIQQIDRIYKSDTFMEGRKDEVFTFARKLFMAKLHGE